jgi:hypothetical protein
MISARITAFPPEGSVSISPHESHFVGTVAWEYTTLSVLQEGHLTSRKEDLGLGYSTLSFLTNLVSPIFLVKLLEKQ